MTFDILQESMPELLEAAFGTLRMTAAAFLLAVSFGLVLALMRLAGGVAGRVALFYIELVRGMPALPLLLLIYFGLVPMGLVLHAFTAAVVALGLNGAAYLAEVYRSGLESVDRGQREAAQMVGLRRGQVLRHIILPQAMPAVLPPMANYLLALLKDTSIVSLIFAPELMLRSRDLAGTYYLPMEFYLLAGAIYLVMAWPLMVGARRLERHLSRGRIQGSTA